jgi:protein-L-isoaspartate(D-aspartate) O-methyltransferase
MTPTARKNRLIRQLLKEKVDQRIIEAFERVPMEDFVDGQYRDMAYGDTPIPISRNRHMLTAADAIVLVTSIGPGLEDKVLQVKTGAGYVATLLGRLSAEVYTTEEDRVLRVRAAERIHRYAKNVHVVAPDEFGYAPAAPYDKAIVAEAIPIADRDIYEQILLQQVRMNGAFLYPIDYGSAEKRLLRRTMPNVERISGVVYVDRIK